MNLPSGHFIKLVKRATLQLSNLQHSMLRERWRSIEHLEADWRCRVHPLLTRAISAVIHLQG